MPIPSGCLVSSDGRLIQPQSSAAIGKFPKVASISAEGVISLEWADPIDLTADYTWTGKHVHNPTLDDDTGDEVALDLSYLVNKATSGDDTGIYANKTDTNSPGTSQWMNYLLDGVPRFTVNGDGTITNAGTPSDVGGTINAYTFTSLEGDSDAAGWGLNYIHGGSLSDNEEGTYDDHVWVMGLNAAGSQVAADPNVAYLALQFESKFTNPGPSNLFGSEWHLEFREPGASSTKRVFSAFMPYDRTNNDQASYTFGLNVLAFYDWEDNIKMQWNVDSGSLDFMDNHLNFSTNNQAIFYQRNAADSAYLKLPYINASDQLLTQAPTLTQGGVPSGQTTAFIFQSTAWDADYNAVMEFKGPTGTGSYYAYTASTSCTTAWITYLNNTNTANASETINRLRAASTTGKAKSHYRSASKGVEVGYDGATGTFQIAPDFWLGVNGENLCYVSMPEGVRANSTWRWWVSQTNNSYTDFAEISAPSAPADGHARFYAADAGSGKTKLCVLFPTGAEVVLATEP